VKLPATPNERLKAKAAGIFVLLEEAFGLPDWRPALSAMDELISTLLSQNTNDRNRDIAFERLKQRFQSWEAARDAPLEEVIEAIRPAGLANQKGARMQGILRQITNERGSLDLTFLKTLPSEQARAWLAKFKGVGPKTAAIVMQFALGLPAFPVDTHVYRVTGRLGLRPTTLNVEETHGWMEKLFEPHQYGTGHLNFIRLGREVCHARSPACATCPLLQACDHPQLTS